jgi:4-hydroxy-tetrahydrodipicolinate synthase
VIEYNNLEYTKGSVILELFKGAATALITPFRDGKIDYVAMGKLIEWQIDEKIDALVVCGTTGEASTLSATEKIQLVKFVVDLVDGRVPVLAGSGSNDTATALKLSYELSGLGVDGLLVLTPYYNKCNDKGLIYHYEKIADAVKVPVIMYAVPSRTGVNISENSLAHLSLHPNIIGIKEASGSISQICQFAQYISDNFNIYSGNDDQAVPVMSLGGLGCISTVSNIIPSTFGEMCRDYLAGNCKEAAAQQVAIKPLVDAMFGEVNPIPIKAALNMMGKCNLEYRLPLCEPSNKTQYLIYDVLEEFNLL